MTATLKKMLLVAMVMSIYSLKAMDDERAPLLEGITRLVVNEASNEHDDRLVIVPIDEEDTAAEGPAEGSVIQGAQTRERRPLCAYSHTCTCAGEAKALTVPYLFMAAAVVTFYYSCVDQSLDLPLRRFLYLCFGGSMFGALGSIFVGQLRYGRGPA